MECHCPCKCGLCRQGDFLSESSVQNGGWGEKNNFTVEKANEQSLSPVIKLNINSDKSSSEDRPLECDVSLWSSFPKLVTSVWLWEQHQINSHRGHAPKHPLSTPHKFAKTSINVPDITDIGKIWEVRKTKRKETQRHRKRTKIKVKIKKNVKCGDSMGWGRKKASLIVNSLFNSTGK